ncbi:MAG: quinone-dependent dihydroorotate dehydrogenase [Leptolyngbyaceae cyanobacterium SL_7_1]|nr:quinone-dependent dihydroorotate dehydrogenase [Leptolyngbyaceae cyanobacterium SL_7_1]
MGTDIYQIGIRPLLFHGLNVDPELLHRWTLAWLQGLEDTDHPIAQLTTRALHRSYCLEHSALCQSLWGLSFANPVGLAAGFDKDAVAVGLWSDFGFGFAEMGTVTLHAQPGNPLPRLFRLPADRAALNRMGFNNQGAEAMAARFQARQQRGLTPAYPVGVNLGKSKVTPLDAAPEDYVGSFRLLKPWGDYFVVNVSSPNTPGLRSLQAADQLVGIVAALQNENQGDKPLLVKIAPDLEWEAIAAIVELAQTYQLAGIIATNTTIHREGLTTATLRATGNRVEDEMGGISGAPLRQRSTEVIRFIYQKTTGTLPIIGVGGIFTAEDAWEKITAGASLVQVYTGWIYEGPWMVRRILTGLLHRLQHHGFRQIDQAVGIDTIHSDGVLPAGGTDGVG